MLNVACVKVGTLYSADYVNVLFDMVRRNLPAKTPGRFVCFTDDATGLDPAILVKPVPQELASRGWWAKLWLFSEDAFPKGERVLYFDLDTCIVGPLDAIAAYDGPFAILRDAYRPDGLQSSVMAWEAGQCDFIYSDWVNFGQLDYEGGDQAWIEHVVRRDWLAIWQDRFPDKFRSYKVDCRFSVPRGTSVVFFHGRPRPHEVTTGWVPEVWKVGGGSGLEFVVQANTSDDQLLKNALNALNYPTWLTMQPSHQKAALIVGGGPSLAETLFYVQGMQKNRCTVFATNNAYRYLKEHGVQPDAHVMLDARPQNVEFVPSDKVPKYYASISDPSVLEAAGEDLIYWHPHQSCCHDHIKHHPSAAFEIGGGTTVGLRAIVIAYILGYRDFRLFGFDSCYRDTHHAYPQSLNDGEKTVEVHVAGQSFRCAPWMVSQAEEFKELIQILVNKGCEISIYGEGLIQSIVQEMQPKNWAQVRAENVLNRLSEIRAPVGAEIGVFSGEMSKRLLSREDVTLYMVDAWAPYSDRSGENDYHATMPQEEHEDIYQAAMNGVRFAGDRAKVMRDWSQDAAQKVPDQSLDFVFIDAEHSYEGCRDDIKAWAPKVKVGGWLMGHDYNNPEFPKWGVERAVQEFATSRGLEVELGDNYTWFIHLPQESRSTT